jgi:phosphoglycolate phosphatase
VIRSLHIAFDLDGTLIDSMRDLGAAARELATSYGGRALGDEEVGLMVGEGASVLVRRTLSAAGVDPERPDALPRFLEIYERRLLDTTVPYPGIEDMLAIAARRARLSVLTNKPLPASRRILDALGLSRYFEAMIGGDGPHGRKPDPAGLRALGAASTDIVLVGDSPIDWATARAAGCEFVWARYGFGARRFEEAPDTPYVMERPADFAPVLDRLTAIRYE